MIDSLINLILSAVKFVLYFIWYFWIGVVIATVILYLI